MEVRGGSVSDFALAVRKESSTAFPGLSAFIQSYRSALSVTQWCLNSPIEMRIVTLFKPSTAEKVALVEISDGSTLQPYYERG
jgi:hypothetical protein